MRGLSVIIMVTMTLAGLMTGVKGQGEGCSPYLQFGSDHTMCQYFDDACTGKVLRRSGGLSCAEKQAVLDAHNKFRQSVAQGQISGQPNAQNMAEMVWDEELATIAQRWTDQCNFGHDKNRKVQKYWAVGQNAAIYYMTITTNKDSNFTSAVNLWFNEVYTPGFPSSNIEPYVFGSGYGHYTQVAWAETYAVGCGFAVFEANSRTNKLYVCNYGPPGNVIGMNMYKIGAPNCSAFSGLSNSPRYSGLCVVSGSKYPGTGC